jgi:hypothetical protein
MARIQSKGPHYAFGGGAKLGATFDGRAIDPKDIQPPATPAELTAMRQHREMGTSPGNSPYYVRRGMNGGGMPPAQFKFQKSVRLPAYAKRLEDVEGYIHEDGSIQPAPPQVRK